MEDFPTQHPCLSSPGLIDPASIYVRTEQSSLISTTQYQNNESIDALLNIDEEIDVFGFLTEEEKQEYFRISNIVEDEYIENIPIVFSPPEQRLSAIKSIIEDQKRQTVVLNELQEEQNEEEEIQEEEHNEEEKNEKETLNSEVKLSQVIDACNVVSPQPFEWKLPEITPEQIIRKIKNVDVTSRFLNDIINNLMKLQQAARYNEETYKICFILYCKSASAYNFLVKLLGLPTISSIQRHYRKELSLLKEQLLSLDQVPLILDRFIRNSNQKQPISASIGVDAAALALFKLKNIGKSITNELKLEEIQEKFVNIIEKKCEKNKQILENDSENDPEYKYFFAVMLEPHNPSLPVTVLHIIKSTDGHLHSNEISIIKSIFQYIQDKGIITKFLIADGDTGMNELHNNVFKTYAPNEEALKTVTLEQMMKSVEDQELWPVLDVLHAVKSARGRLIDNKIAIWSTQETFDADDLEEHLQLGLPLTDKSPTGKMKDSYAISLFSMINSLSEYSEDRTGSGLYLILYAFILEAYKNPALSKCLRLTYVDISIELLRRIYFADMHASKDEFIGLRGFKRYFAVSFTDRIFIIKMLNTMISFRYVLISYGNNLCISRHTSQVVENFFGNYRENTSNGYSIASVETYVARTTLTYSFINELDLLSTKRSKDNMGGTIINEQNDSKLIQLQCPLTSIQVANLLMNIATYDKASWKSNESLKTPFNAFIQWLITIYTMVFKFGGSITRYTQTISSGQKIIKRFIDQHKSK